MNPVPFSWMIVAILALGVISGGGGFWYGYRYANRAAEISDLTDKLAIATKTLAARQDEAKRNAQTADEFRARAADAATQIHDMQEAIDALSSKEAEKPATDVCRLDGDDLQQLLALARRASVRQADPSRRP